VPAGGVVPTQPRDRRGLARRSSARGKSPRPSEAAHPAYSQSGHGSNSVLPTRRLVLRDGDHLSENPTRLRYPHPSAGQTGSVVRCITDRSRTPS
jgi:hypothetical protein